MHPRHDAPDEYEKLLCEFQDKVRENEEEACGRLLAETRIRRFQATANRLLQEKIQLSLEVEHLTSEMSAFRGAVIAAETQLEMLREEVKILQDATQVTVENTDKGGQATAEYSHRMICSNDLSFDESSLTPNSEE